MRATAAPLTPNGPHAPSAARPSSIKLASENKINAKNTWSLALIDHLSDLVKAEKDDDTSTNFQKVCASLCAASPPAQRAG